MATWRTATSRVLVALAILVGVLAVLAVGAVLLVQSEWAERRIERLAADRLGRDVEIEGLRVLAAWPPQVELGGVRIANPPWARDPFLLDARGLRAAFEPAALLRGRAVATAAVDHAAVGLERQGERNTWSLGAEDADTGGIEGDREPGTTRFVARSLSIGEARIAYYDKADRTDVVVRASGDLGRAGRPFEVKGEGRFRGDPLELTAGAPAVPLEGEQPVELAFDATLGKNRAEGRIALRAASGALQSIRGHIQASGSSIAALNNVARAELPKSAPYRLAADVRHEEGRWIADNLEATLGRSDLQGWISLEPREQRPLLRAKLTSRRFDVEEAGVEQKVEEKLEQEWLIPTGKLWTDAWGLVDADVELSVKKVLNAQPVPFDAIALHAVLENSSLRIDPFDVSLANGTVRGRAALDAGEQPDRGGVSIQIRGLRLSRLFPDVQKKESALGSLSGRVELSGRGDTPAQLLGDAEGRILLAVQRGTTSGLLVEVLGLDAAEAVMLLGEKKTSLPLRCAVADLKVNDGIAKVSTFVIDATDTVLSIEGSVSLGQETINLTGRAEPRDASVFTLRTPADVTGTFLDPKVRPHVGPLAGRAGAAIALAALNPLLALIPFVDPGGDPEPGCQPQKR